MKKNKLSPQDKLLKAVAKAQGLEYKTDTELEAEIEEAVNSMTDEEYRRITGHDIHEDTHELMLFAGWLDMITFWRRTEGTKRKYTVSGSEPVFTSKQVCDLAQLAYRQGREDQAAGVSEYDRLWKLNKNAGEGEA